MTMSPCCSLLRLIQKAGEEDRANQEVTGAEPSTTGIRPFPTDLWTICLQSHEAWRGLSPFSGPFKAATASRPIASGGAAAPSEGISARSVLLASRPETAS